MRSSAVRHEHSWTLHLFIYSHWNKKGIHSLVFYLLSFDFSPYSLRGSVENSSHMGFKKSGNWIFRHHWPLENAAGVCQTAFQDFEMQSGRKCRQSPPGSLCSPVQKTNPAGSPTLPPGPALMDGLLQYLLQQPAVLHIPSLQQLFQFMNVVFSIKDKILLTLPSMHPRNNPPVTLPPTLAQFLSAGHLTEAQVSDAWLLFKDAIWSGVVPMRSDTSDAFKCLGQQASLGE